MEAAESLFKCLEQVADPREAEEKASLSGLGWGVRRHPRQSILRLTLLGLVCGQTTMAHLARFARMHGPMLKEPLGFVRDHPPHATTISAHPGWGSVRAVAGSPHRLGGPCGGGTEVLGRRQVGQAVGGCWWGMMVNVLAHDLKRGPVAAVRYEPGVLREQLGQLSRIIPACGC